VRQNDDIPTLGRAGREMIQCDLCNLSWHLECLDPPLAVAPKKSKINRITWTCPNHIDSLLNDIDPQANTSNKDRPTISRRYKIRRPKNAIFVDTALSRGFKNNGLIEVINEPSDDETFTLKKYETESPKSLPQLLRAPEKSLKLDFIDRVKR